MLPFSEEAQRNRDLLRDCLCESVVLKTRLATKDAAKKTSRGRRRQSQANSKVVDTLGDDAEELADFVDYLASEMFVSLPQRLQTITFAATKSDVRLSESYGDPLPTTTTATLLANIPCSVTDSLDAYHLVTPGSEANLLIPVLQNYCNTATSPPPTHNPTVRAVACEICGRDWVPLSYHHLIPREVHAKAVKRGWHEEWELQSVAWLCRACHGCVHMIESNEELAKNWYTVERLMEREDMQQWAKWVGRVRWKAR